MQYYICTLLYVNIVVYEYLSICQYIKNKI